MDRELERRFAEDAQRRADDLCQDLADVGAAGDRLNAIVWDYADAEGLTFAEAAAECARLRPGSFSAYAKLVAGR
jgi:hypothetical protein